MELASLEEMLQMLINFQIFKILNLPETFQISKEDKKHCKTASRP